MRFAEVAAFLDAMPDAIVVAAADGRIRFMNHQAEALFGYQRDELTGQLLERLIPPEFRERHPAFRTGYFERPVFRPMGAGRELSALRADGSTFAAEISLGALEMEEGIFVSAAVRDITERRRADARFRGLLEAAPDAMVGVNVDGVIVMVNSQAEKLFGYPRDQLLGQPVEILVPEAVRHAHPEYRTRYFSTPTTRPMGVGLELAGRRSDGSEFPAEISLSALEGEEGRLVTAAIRDVSERKRIEAEREELQVRQSERLEVLGQLAGGIAHDFNNLLALILSYGRFVARRVADDPGLSEDVGEILAAAERAATLTRQLLIFGRREVVRPQVLDLNEVVASMEKLLRRTIGEHIDLQTSFAADLPSVFADPGQLEQVVVNLAVNARDAMAGGGVLRFRTDVVVRPGSEGGDAQWVRLTVEDTGHGMSAEVKARIFEPFFTTKPKGQGTGLGLATVYAIVSQAGGRIDLYSEEGQGTAFRLLFPGVDSEARPLTSAGERHEPPRGEGRTVLVVEDEPGVRQMTSRILRDHGYVVVEAESPAGAIERCASGLRPDILVTDVVMPGMSGRDVADAIAQLMPELPIVFMSGYSHDVIAHQGVLDPGVRLVEKPFTEAELLGAVGAALT